MRITIDRKPLLAALETVKPTAGDLKRVYLSTWARDGDVWLEVTGGSHTARTTVRVPEYRGEAADGRSHVSEGMLPGSAVIPHGEFVKLIRALEAGPVSLRTDDGRLWASWGSAPLLAGDAHDLPVAHVDGGATLTLAAEDIPLIQSAIVPAVSENDTRPTLTAIRLRREGDGVVIEASDGNRLHQLRRPWKGDLTAIREEAELGRLLDPLAIKALGTAMRKFKGAGPDRVWGAVAPYVAPTTKPVRRLDQRVTWHWGPVTVTSGSDIASSYPSTDQLVADDRVGWGVPYGTLAAVGKRVKALGIPILRFHPLAAGGPMVYGADPDADGLVISYRERLDGAEIDGNGVGKFAVSADYFADAIAPLKGKYVRIEHPSGARVDTSASAVPMVIRSDAVPGLRMVVMPMYVDWGRTMDQVTTDAAAPGEIPQAQ